MPARRSFALVHRLDRITCFLDAIERDPALAALLEAFGYDAAAIQHGHALHKRVVALQRAQEREHGNRYDAIDAVNAARRRAEDSYKVCVRIARVALRDDRAALDGLGVKQLTKASLATWVYNARRFYANALANAAVLDRLAGFNISRERLEAARGEVEALEQAQHHREQAQRRAQAATAARDEAMAALDRWMRDCTEVARVATRGQPLLRARLGLR